MSRSKGLDALRIDRAQHSSASPSVEAASGSVPEAVPPMPQGGWQPIATAPRDGVAVWIAVKGQPCMGFCEPANWLHAEDRWFAKATFVRRGAPGDHRATPTSDNIYCCHAVDVHPTHWQPLPAPPTDGDA